MKSRRPTASKTAPRPARPEAAEEAIYFDSPAAFRRWLERNHATAKELWVGFHKKATGVPSLTWPESVDEALCFGWIDGVRHSVDASRYRQRFTPRRAGSVWSAINLRRVEALVAAGRMTPAGLAAYEARRTDRTNRYSFEQEGAGLAPAHERLLKKSRKAWAFWIAQPPGYRKTASWWVESAKQEETRRRRLDRLIADCEDGQRIAPLRRETRRS
jgi:uncharacterized protein YdeI (YjbR/CyaY-like superfamily)